MKKARRHQFTGPRSGTSSSLDKRYELYKEAWRVNHPDATPAEYEKAMSEIARKLGL